MSYSSDRSDSRDISDSSDSLEVGLAVRDRGHMNVLTVGKVLTAVTVII